jgi:hypothetical protein
MKSDQTKSKPARFRWLPALLLPLLACQATAQDGCEVAVAALSLPAGADGLLHWREAEAASLPLQLSTRYFSDPVKLTGKAIRFYGAPVPAGPTQPGAAAPLLTMTFPADMTRGYLVLWTEPDEKQEPRWKGMVVNAAEWKAGSMKVINACNEAIGIEAGEKRIKLLPGKSMDFAASQWREPFPVKVSRLEPAIKTLFSSTWRIAPERREICFVGNVNGSITLRSLLELDKAPEPVQE